MQKWTILYNINFGFSSEVISIHIDPELYTPSQNRMLKKKKEKNGKELLLWEKNRLPVDDKGSTYVLFQ